MIDLTAYQGSLLWLGILLSLIMLQWLIATVAKARLPGAVPGLPPSDHAHSSFAFRAWRTHQNSMENSGTMIGGALFAMLAGANGTWVESLLAILVITRVVHMVLYYAIATERNPSPRSYFFALSWLANVALILAGFLALG